MARNNELIRLAKKAADKWRGTDAYHQAAQIIDMLVEELEAPTLTPPNEWVEALEAINNAAVAYIEGGPYENDLPGMEFAVEIDRLSQDFVRPQNGPLTQADLDVMDYDKVWIDYGDDGEWALVVSGRIYALAVLEGAGFGDILRDEVDGETMDRPSGNYTVYRRPPDGV